MIHNQHVSLGIDRPVILDWAGFQTIIDYRLFKTPRDLYDRLREIGVTHVVVPATGRNAATLQDDVIFENVRLPLWAATATVQRPRRVPDARDAPAPRSSLPGARRRHGGLSQRALWRRRPHALRPVPTQHAAPGDSPPDRGAADLIGAAKVALIGPAGLDAQTNERLTREFELIGSPPGVRIFLRRK
jgi:hypothetical protein